MSKEKRQRGQGAEASPGAADEILLPRPPAPLFLARQVYRQRRAGDAGRILPMVGVVLFCLPILWQPALSPEPDTAPAAVWLFSVWGILILCAFLLARRLAERDDRDPTPSLDQRDPDRGPRG